MILIDQAPPPRSPTLALPLLPDPLQQEDNHGLYAFLEDLVNQAPAPFLALLPDPAPTPEQPRRSVRLSIKPNAKMGPVDKACVVLLKKLDILAEAPTTLEERKQRLIKIFKGPVSRGCR